MDSTAQRHPVTNTHSPDTNTHPLDTNTNPLIIDTNTVPYHHKRLPHPCKNAEKLPCFNNSTRSRASPEPPGRRLLAETYTDARARTRTHAHNGHILAETQRNSHFSRIRPGLGPTQLTSFCRIATPVAGHLTMSAGDATTPRVSPVADLQ